MTLSSVDRKVSPLLLSTLALLLTLGCSNGGGSSSSEGNGSSGGSDGGSAASGGSSAASGTITSGSSPAGGSSAGGSSSSAAANSGGSSTISSLPGSGGNPTGGTTAKGGTANAGGTTAKGGTTSTATGTGGTLAKDAGAGPDGSPSTGSKADGGGSCPTAMPEGGETKTGKSVYGTANGLGYGIWTNGDGGSITVYPNAHAFSASWSESKDFLAHLGLDFRPAKEWTTYGTITAEYSEVKSGTAGGFSMIGMYGWTQSPCVEWYINEDSWKGLGGGGSVTAEIDGGTYYLKTLQTTGTGGANACESGHTGPWTQMISTRKTARTCGTVTVSDHFAAWEKQGWKMGVLTSVHINVEVGGGTGKIDFPLANVTTQNK